MWNVHVFPTKIYDFAVQYSLVITTALLNNFMVAFRHWQGLVKVRELWCWFNTEKKSALTWSITFKQNNNLSLTLTEVLLLWDSGYKSQSLVPESCALYACYPPQPPTTSVRYINVPVSAFEKNIACEQNPGSNTRLLGKLFSHT